MTHDNSWNADEMCAAVIATKHNGPRRAERWKDESSADSTISGSCAEEIWEALHGSVSGKAIRHRGRRFSMASRQNNDLFSDRPTARRPPLVSSRHVSATCAITVLCDV